MWLGWNGKTSNVQASRSKNGKDCINDLVLVGNEKGVFQLRGGEGVSTTILTLEDSIRFKCLTIDVGQNDSERSWIDQCQSWAMPISIPNIDELKKASGLIKHEVVIYVNPNKLANYTTMQAQTMITHVTSYDILLRGYSL